MKKIVLILTAAICAVGITFVSGCEVGDSIKNWFTETSDKIAGWITGDNTGETDKDKTDETDKDKTDETDEKTDEGGKTEEEQPTNAEYIGTFRYVGKWFGAGTNASDSDVYTITATKDDFSSSMQATDGNTIAELNITSDISFTNYTTKEDELFSANQITKAYESYNMQDTNSDGTADTKVTELIFFYYKSTDSWYAKVGGYELIYKFVRVSSEV